ncbi:unnamed protein product [Withania somnifera]
MRQRREKRRVGQKERPPKVRTTKIGLVIRSFDHPFFENHFWGLPPFTRNIGLLESRVLYTSQYEILFSCKTRSDKGKVQRLL